MSKKEVKNEKLRTFTFVVGDSLFLIRRKGFSDALIFIKAHFGKEAGIKLSEIKNLTVMTLSGRGEVTDFSGLKGDFKIESK